MQRLTILDDYQQAALTSTDWSTVAERFQIDVITEHISDEDDVAARLADSVIVVLMRERTPMTASLLSRLPQLRLIVTTGRANAAIDLDAARQHGVTVCATTNSVSGVAELTIGMMIALARHIVAEDTAIRSGRWQHTIGTGLHGKTLGIVGLGRLGQPVAHIAQALGMVTTAWSPNLTAERAEPYGVRAVTKRELFIESDVITIHMPLSERSRGLIAAGDLALMKPTAFLVNTSRGPIVDEAALADALRREAIGGAALDVFGVEPLPVDDPVRTLPRTLLLPHIGYVTADAYASWYADVVEDVLAWADGVPIREL